MGESWVWKGATALLAIAVVILLVVIGNIVQTEKTPENNFQLVSSVEIVAEPQYGVFIDRPPVLKGKMGRTNGDLENTAVLLETSNFNDTMRWIKGIIRSRISDNDLWVYIHFGLLVNETDVKMLRHEVRNNRWIKGVHVSKGSNSSLIEEILKVPHKKYIISIRDTDYMGVDFADFYFLGKKVMELDEKINCVCGGDSYRGPHADGFFQPDQGGLLWLSDSECTKGLMVSRNYYTDDNTGYQNCLRPEVWRVSDSAQHVTKMGWKLAQHDPNLLTTKEFPKRIQHDFEHGVRKQKVEWNTLRSVDSDKVYVFPFSDSDDLQHYFEEEQILLLLTTKIYDGTLMTYYEGHQVYIEPVSNEITVLPGNSTETNQSATVDQL